MMSALARVVVRRTARRVVRVVRASLPVFALVPANAVRRAAIAIDESNPIQIKSNQSRVTSRVAVWRRGRGRGRGRDTSRRIRILQCATRGRLDDR
jgi:hypothetical protein